MKKVFKYPLIVDDMQTVELPKGSKVLHINKQGGDERLYLWALVDPEESETEGVRIRCAGTGHPIEEDGLEYVSTVFMLDGALVFHFFVVNPVDAPDPAPVSDISSDGHFVEDVI